MPSTGLIWVRSPNLLQNALKEYGDRALVAIQAVAQYTATVMQNDARSNAAWTDRTGNARAGLFGTAEADFGQKIVTIYLSHGATIDYGVYLELAHGGRYAVIMRTMEAHLDELRAMLDDVLRD